MISAIVFSRDRPAQLDLLLRSIKKNTNLRAVTVLYKSTSPEFTSGYVTCNDENPWVEFIEESKSFKRSFETIVRRSGEYVVPLVDDDMFLRYIDGSIVEWVMNARKDLLCFSLRLGNNTKYCYSMDSRQALPERIYALDGFFLWEWRKGELDFGYPGSLDGHVFRTEELIQLIQADEYVNPNTLEDVLSRSCLKALLPLMGSCLESVLVGLPVNRVNETHLTNRHARDESAEDINKRFLRNERISLDTVDILKVNSAHVEFPLKWERRS